MKNVHLAEFQPMPTGSDFRKKVWAIGIGGAYAMILFMGIASTPVNDLQICDRLVQLMEATRFNEIRPDDSLTATRFYHQGTVNARLAVDLVLLTQDR